MNKRQRDKRRKVAMRRRLALGDKATWHDILVELNKRMPACVLPDGRVVPAYQTYDDPLFWRPAGA